MTRVQQGQSAKIDTSTASAAERTSAMAKLPSHEGWAHLEHNERAAVWNPIVHELEERAMKGDLTGAAADLVTLGHRTGNSAAIAAIQDYVEEHGGPSKRLSADQVSQLQKVENHDIKDPVERARIAADIYAKTGNRDARDVLRRASDELLKDGNTKINAEHARMKAAADQKDDGSTARADGQKHQQMQLFTQGPKPAAARAKARASVLLCRRIWRASWAA